METCVTGQIIHKRSVSKKLLFIDILREGHISIKEKSSSDTENYGRVTIIFKSDFCGEQMIKSARTPPSKIHVGDIIKFQGNFEGDESLTFLPTAFTLVNAWEEINPGKSFCPIPPTRYDTKYKIIPLFIL